MSNNTRMTAIEPAFGLPVYGRRPFGASAWAVSGGDTSGIGVTFMGIDVRGGHQAALETSAQGTLVWRPPDC